MTEPFKYIRIKFDELDVDDSKLVWDFIHQSIRTRAGDADTKFDPDSAKKLRKDVRVMFRVKIQVKAATEDSQKLKGREFQGLIADLSMGGIGLRVDQRISLATNSRVKLEFVTPGKDRIKLEGTILGLRYEDQKPGGRA